jgi:hypothetical protein
MNSLLTSSTELSDPTRSTDRAVSLRSVLLGLIGVLFINLLTPFNNYVVNNTNLVGNHLPVGLLLFYVTFAVLVNGPLTRWRSRFALSRGEMSVALAMTLVGCAVPAVGLMRYLPGHLVAFWWYALSDHASRVIMQKLDLPDWLFPTLATHDIAQRGNDPVVRNFYNAIPLDNRSFLNSVRAIPWAAWVTPAITWGILLGALWGAVLCLSVIFRRQWAVDERLPFPLASIYLTLIEPPQPRQWVNPLLRSPSFWIAAATVFLIHLQRGLHIYQPTYFPDFPLHYSLSDIFTQEPWRFTEGDFQNQTISFTIIGLMYFVRSSLAFSVWFFFVVVQIVHMVYGYRQWDWEGGMETDQRLGALLPIGVAILYVARVHLKTIILQMFRGRRGFKPVENYLPYGLLGWIFVGCVITMVIWLCAAGASLAGAVVLVGLLLLVFLVVMRIVSETGLLYVLPAIPLNRPWTYLASDMPQFLTVRTTLRSYFFSSMFWGLFMHDTREALAGFAPNALRMGDEGAELDKRKGSQPKLFIACLALALAVAYVSGGASTLFVHYTHASTLDNPPDTPIAAWGTIFMPKYLAIDETNQYIPPGTGARESHSRMKYFAAGVVISAGLSYGRLRYAGWPFDPLAYLLVNTWGIHQIWFSVFLGWLAKALLLRIGGSSLFRAARPAFIGLIIGESAAVALWLTVSFVLALNGLPYHQIQLLPN